MHRPAHRHDWPQTPAEHRVVVLGASPKPARYANQALRLLKERGYRVIPVHPSIREIEGLPAIRRLCEIRDPVHTLTLYVGPERSRELASDIVALHPGRVILNPGTESPELEAQLHTHHVEHFHACTLVLLRTGQF